MVISDLLLDIKSCPNVILDVSACALFSRLPGGQTYVSLDLNTSVLPLTHLVDEGTNMQVLGDIGMDLLSDLPNSTVGVVLKYYVNGEITLHKG